MSYVQNVRAKIDQSLDRWEMAAQSAEDSIEATQAVMTDRIEQQKAKAIEAADHLKQTIGRAQQLPADARDKIASDLDHLKVQLALGKAEAHDALAEQKNKIIQAAREAEHSIDELDRQTDLDIDAAVEQWIQADVALQQEFDLVAMHLAQERAEARTKFEAKKQELRDEIKQFRASMEANRDQAAEKGEQFAADMNAAFGQIKKAFHNLTS